MLVELEPGHVPGQRFFAMEADYADLPPLLRALEAIRYRSNDCALF